MIECLKKLINKKEEKKVDVLTRIEEMYNSLTTDEILICVGADLSESAKKLCDKIAVLRENLFDSSGFILPAVRIVDKVSLQENEYHFQIQGNIAFVGFSLFSEDDAIAEISQNFELTCIEHISEIFSNRMTEKYVESVQRENAYLVWNLSNMLPIWDLKTILTDLIKDGKSIKNITYIFEKICEVTGKKGDGNYISDPHKISKKLIKHLSFS
ncbi:MAG: FHIPEP family type III secretion protein [bacterium]|nr:FHIPEP family type III secretion protein [bacterium]